MSPRALVELHLHLDISMSFEVAARLIPGLTEARYRSEFQGPARCDDLADFLSTTTTQVSLLQNTFALRLLTDDVVRRLAREGVVYAELRFAPLLHTADGTAPEAAVEAVLTAAAEATKDTGLDTSIILCTLRHFDEFDSLRTADLAIRYADHGVAFDLAGDEAGFPLATHLPAFRHVIEAGVPFTIHAGEGAGPESVTEVLDAVSPGRIGHGVRAIEDPSVVERLILEGTHLETCPSCNVQLGLYPGLRDHPIDRLYRSGVSLGVSTDSRTSTVTSMQREFASLADTFGWTSEDKARVSRMAIDAAFASPEVKDRVRAKIAASYRAGC